MSSGKPPFSFGLTVAAQRAIADAKTREEARIRMAEHRMEQEARLAEFRRKRAEANAALPAALAALDAITEQPETKFRAIRRRILAKQPCALCAGSSAPGDAEPTSEDSPTASRSRKAQEIGGSSE